MRKILLGTFIAITLVALSGNPLAVSPLASTPLIVEAYAESTQFIGSERGSDYRIDYYENGGQTYLAKHILGLPELVTDPQGNLVTSYMTEDEDSWNIFARTNFEVEKAYCDLIYLEDGVRIASTQYIPQESDDGITYYNIPNKVTDPILATEDVPINGTSIGDVLVPSEIIPATCSLDKSSINGDDTYTITKTIGDVVLKVPITVFQDKQISIETFPSIINTESAKYLQIKESLTSLNPSITTTALDDEMYEKVDDGKKKVKKKTVDGVETVQTEFSKSGNQVESPKINLGEFNIDSTKAKSHLKEIKVKHANDKHGNPTLVIDQYFTDGIKKNPNAKMEYDPTFQQADDNAYQFRDGQYAASEGQACGFTSGSAKNAIEKIYYAKPSNSGSGCHVPAFQWDVSSIPDTVTIGSVIFELDWATPPASDNNFACDIRQVETDITGTFDATMWSALTTDTTYVDADTNCRTAQTDHQYNLGSEGIADLQATLTGDDLFTISWMLDDHSRRTSGSGEGSYYGGTPSNEELIVVYYTPISPDAPTNDGVTNVGADLKYDWTFGTNFNNATQPAITNSSVYVGNTKYQYTPLANWNATQETDIGDITTSSNFEGIFHFDIDFGTSSTPLISFDFSDVNGITNRGTGGSTYDATNYGATTGQTGIRDEAYDYSGTDQFSYLTIPASEVINGHDVGSFSLWYNADAVHAGVLFGCTDGSSYGTKAMGLYHQSNSNDLHWLVRNGGTIPDNLTITTGHSYNTWNHIVVVNDGSSATKFYINGVQTTSANTSHWFNYNAGYDQCAIGSFIGDDPTTESSQEWNGLIDDFNYFDYTLTETEITDLYNSGLSVDASLGFTAFDYSGDDNHGIITGIYAVDPTPLVRFDFSDTNGLTNLGSGGSSYDGTNTGATSGSTGIVNQAYSYDGTNDQGEIASTTNTLSFLHNAQGSISVWLNPDTTDNNEIIFDTTDSTGTNTGIVVRFETGNVINSMILGATDTSITSSGVWTTGAWQHLVLVNDGANSKIYRNGVEVATGTLTTNSGDSTYDFHWGESALLNDFPYDGLIDDLMIFNSALTSAQVTALYNSGSSVTTGTASVKTSHIDTGYSNEVQFDNAGLNVTSSQWGISGTNDWSINGIVTLNQTDPISFLSFDTSGQEVLLRIDDQFIDLQKNAVTIFNHTLSTALGNGSPNTITITRDTSGNYETLINGTESVTSTDATSLGTVTNNLYHIGFDTSLDNSGTWRLDELSIRSDEQTTQDSADFGERIQPFTFQASVTAPTTTYTHTGLAPQTDSCFKVTAWNSVGESTASGIECGTTNDPSPTQPTGLSATDISESQINLSWDTAPAYDNITGYRIFYESPVGNGWIKLVNDTGTSLVTYSHTSLSTKTQYNYMVAGINATGVGSNSTNAFTTTWGVPDAPTGFSIINPAVDQLTLNYTASVPFGYPVTGYEVYRDNVQISADIGNVTSYTDTGLAAVTSYDYAVRALSSFGSSGWANATGTTVTSPPTSLTVNDCYHTCTTQLNLEWVAPVPDTGVNGYKIETESPIGGGWSTLVANTTTTTLYYNHTGLANDGVFHNYRIYALTPQGESAVSNTYAYTTHKLPDSVTDLVVTDDGLLQFVLNWGTPSNLHGSLSGYMINYTTPAGDPLTIESADTGSALTTYTKAGNDPTVEYSFRVSAVTNHGTNSTFGNIFNYTLTTPLEVGALTFSSPDNTNVVPYSYMVIPVSNTTDTVRVTFDSSFTTDCTIEQTLSGTTNSYTGLSETAGSGSSVYHDFSVQNTGNDILEFDCWDQTDNTQNGQFVFTVDQTGLGSAAMPLVDQVQNFTAGLYGTNGEFGEFDLITLFVIILSMLGFNRKHPALGVGFMVVALGATRYYGLIGDVSLAIGGIAMISALAIGVGLKKF